MSVEQMKEDDKFSILHYTRSEHNMLWDFFQKIEAYYLSNTFEYSIQQIGNTIIYKEYYNKEEINVLQFETTSLHWQILCACNEHVLSITKLDIDANIDKIFEVISDLQEEGILYSSVDKQEIVSVINTNIRM